MCLSKEAYMYLTHLELDIKNPGARQCLANCHDMHRSLMKGFPQYESESPRETAKMLYRVISNNKGASVFMQSEEKPELSRYVLLSPEVRETQNIDALYEKMEIQKIWGFELLAVPTKKQSREGKTSHRVFLKTEVERTEWLKRQSLSRGFKILDCYEKKSDHICGKNGTNYIKFDAAVFSGTFEITDEKLFWEKMSEGIGPEKAYGAGMIMLALR